MTQRDMTSLEYLARHFAVIQHGNQVRKYTGEPYWRHCRAVAERVAAEGGSEEMICAAWLHDCIEDTDTTYAQLFEKFGAEISGLVLELTDRFTTERYPTWNRAARKEAECARMSGISPNAKQIKLADIADNTKDIVANDPKFASIYLREKADMLEVLT